MKLFDFDKLIGTLTGYIETKIELLKLDAKEGISVAITKVLMLVVGVLLAVFVTIFLFLGLAALLNQAMKSTYLGYFIVTGFFAILLVIFIASRDKITARIKEKLQEADTNNKRD